MLIMGLRHRNESAMLPVDAERTGKERRGTCMH